LETCSQLLTGHTVFFFFRISRIFKERSRRWL